MAGEPGEWQPFAGGTDLMVLFEAGKLQHKNFLSLWHLRELCGIEVGAEFVAIGALTTYTEILRNEVLQKEFALLCQAARETGGVATQNRGTLGGNIANASPAADSPPALLAYDAEIELISAAGERRMPYLEFHTDYKKTKMRADEIIRAVRLLRRGVSARECYRKVGTRKAQAISKVCFAARVESNGRAIRDARIALGSVAPTVLRCVQTENALRAGGTIAQAREALRREIAPIDDIRSTARYRARAAENLLEQFLLEVGLR
jgi:CO/xanthine dehydrogenase FAD-binding subunit